MLDTPEGRARVFDFAMASASFPGAFTPFELDRLGPCVDGGSVNNTPIKRALDAGATRVLVVTASPRVHPRSTREAGFALVGDLAGDPDPNERLYRDLHDAETVNTQVDALHAFERKHALAPGACAELEAIFGSPRRVEIVEIRPPHALEGDAFTGFFCARTRRRYIEIGRECARAKLDAIGVSATRAR